MRKIAMPMRKHRSSEPGPGRRIICRALPVHSGPLLAWLLFAVIVVVDTCVFYVSALAFTRAHAIPHLSILVCAGVVMLRAFFTQHIKAEETKGKGREVFMTIVGARVIFVAVAWTIAWVLG